METKISYDGPAKGLRKHIRNSSNAVKIIADGAHSSTGRRAKQHRAAERTHAARGPLRPWLRKAADDDGC